MEGNKELIRIINESVPLNDKEDVRRRVELFKQFSSLKEYSEKKIKIIVENIIQIRSCPIKRQEDKLIRMFLIEKLNHLKEVA